MCIVIRDQNERGGGAEKEGKGRSGRDLGGTLGLHVVGDLGPGAAMTSERVKERRGLGGGPGGELEGGGREIHGQRRRRHNSGAHTARDRKVDNRLGEKGT